MLPGYIHILGFKPYGEVAQGSLSIHLRVPRKSMQELFHVLPHDLLYSSSGWSNLDTTSDFTTKLSSRGPQTSIISHTQP